MNKNQKLFELTLKEASDKLSSGEITSSELTKAIFGRIEEIEPKVEAFITITKEIALKQAVESDKRRKNGKPLSPIDGIPIAVKDLFNTKGVRTTAASKILDDFIPQYESTATQKLWDAGAVLVGKTNLDQFAMGSSTESSAYKTTKNPWDLERVPGGSSGGSAAAVAADMCIAALGTDTGGSIRQPSSLCGIVGLKTTYGRVSRYGVNAMASSLDTIGPMTKSVEDAAILLNVIAGLDKNDSTTLEQDPPDFSKALTGNVKGMKVGIPKEFFGQGMDKEVSSIVSNAIDKFKDGGAEIIDVSLPSVKYALDVYYIIVWAEVASDMAKYDGIRFGHSKIKEKTKGSSSSNQDLCLKSKNDKISLEDVYITARTEGLGDEVKRRIMLGNYVLSSGYYDAYYKKAQAVRSLVKKDFDRVFSEVDILITPVSPTAAFKIGEKTDDPLQMYLSDIHTVPINPAGVPAISVPAGFTKSKLPVGIQIIAPQLEEERILRAADFFEKVINIKNERAPIK